MDNSNLNNINFEEVERLLFFNSVSKIKPGLERIGKLLENLNNPQNSFPSIHIVGTNGKGSTAAFIESIFRASGYKTGLYSSPHLESPGERLLINGKELNPSEWFEAVNKAIKFSPENNNDRVSFFELLTSSAFLLAEKNNIDVGVIEAGLGGRFDATNLLGRVECSVIASISMDHMEYLGNTLESIAGEKFAVVRENKPSCFSGNDKSLINLFKKFCIEKNSIPFVLTEDSKIENLKITDEGIFFDFYSEDLNLKNIQTGLIGSYQVNNTALALLAISKLKKSFPKITNDTILNGIKNARWPGRLEIISKDPFIILDGGHNPGGVESLVKSIKTLWPDKKLGIVYAVMKDKDFVSCLNILNELNPAFYATCIPETERSLKSEELLNASKNFKWRNIPSSFENPEDAVNKSIKENDITVICGSLYLVGLMRSILK